MTFNIIGQMGEVRRAQTPQDVTVYRQEFLYAGQFGIVRCTPYSEHFIYENPDKRPGTPGHLCTCGSTAVVANAYDEGRMFVCLNHATYGFHQTSQVNKKDFEQGKPVIRRGKRWV